MATVSDWRVIYKVSVAVEEDADFQPVACDGADTLDEVVTELVHNKIPLKAIRIEVYQYTDRREGTWEL
jgi:hypothetical protein